jgi:hypothetical protein
VDLLPVRDAKKERAAYAAQFEEEFEAFEPGAAVLLDDEDAKQIAA